MPERAGGGENLACGGKYADAAANETVSAFPDIFRFAGGTMRGDATPPRLRETELRPGFWLSVMDFVPRAAVRFRYEKHYPLVDFSFVLAGDMRNNLHAGPVSAREIANRTGAGGVGFLPGATGLVEIAAGQRLQLLHLHIEPRLLQGLLEGQWDSVPEDFRRAVEGAAGGGYLHLGEMDPAVRGVAYEVLCGPRPGVPGRLFLEGKALELLALQLARIGSRKGGQGDRPLLSPSERDRIHAARELLVEDLASPPTLPELARRVGLSVSKLGAGFRDQFGTTVYGVFREYQLQKARLLFEQGDLNVSQVAWAVGYTNVSHFSAAYKKRFGLQPKTYLRSARRKRFPG